MVNILLQLVIIIFQTRNIGISKISRIGGKMNIRSKQKCNETWQHCCSFLHWAYNLATPLTSSIGRREEAVMSTQHISCQRVPDKQHTWLPELERCNHVKPNVCKASQTMIYYQELDIKWAICVNWVGNLKVKSGMVLFFVFVFVF